jgi:hypothetical protein
MKVITQLIRHFWQRGTLAYDQAEYLLDQGFARPADLPGFQRRQRSEESERVRPILYPQPLEIATEEIQPAPRRRGPGGPKGSVPEADDLRLWLRKQFARRRRALPTLIRLAQRFGPCSRWQDAAVLIRQVEPRKFGQGFAAALRLQQVGLRSLWQAIDPEPLHARMIDPTLRGPTVRAFRILLATDDPRQLGKYVWILKLDEVQAACNLLQVHRRLLGGLHELWHNHRPVLNAALRHSTHPVPHWALVLLHNAGRKSSGNSVRPAHEYGPVAPPADDVWQQAWTSALVMDAPIVTRLLVNCYGRTRAGQSTACGQLLYCPQGWKLP